ncbi:3659_t:CDS:2 [Racocetra persica]|uniref:3659_t:CDS:1 n=1 Tax=Racocetra persica TaxID=160502 RepID=A0ACA9KXB7_9GLOM|nr:3659_t:CDS:2 [Racocetra persica]
MDIENNENDENAEYYNQDDELDNQLTQTSDGNISTNSNKNTRKLSPLWQYFSFDPNYSDISICDKYSQKFSSKSSNSSLESKYRKAINDVFVEFNLVNKILALITDNESTILVCRSAYYRLEIVDQYIINIRILMSKIKGSIILYDELKELCNVQKLDYLKPELDIVTR